MADGPGKGFGGERRAKAEVVAMGVAACARGGARVARDVGCVVGELAVVRSIE